MRYAARVEYDGTDFSGWQTQKHDVRTVQQEVERALSKVADHPLGIVTAGRTDTGVHATHQVIHFDSDAGRSEIEWLKGCNRFMSHDVRLHWVRQVDDEFHARFGAISRSYRFIIWNESINSAISRNYATHEYRDLDAGLMAGAGELLLGEHDFSSFRAAGCQAHSPLRTVQKFSLSQQGQWLWFDITANAFLQHMVRNIAGALVEVGCGKRSIGWFEDLLEVRDRTRAGITAAANGLYLVGVEYPPEFALPSQSSAVALWSEASGKSNEPTSR
ncbi:MAG: tRNA pseudouridine(38-40) synthase TruA [Gammaproteobacteria bacterium]|nr:tRNA pseudouridine(38-40) synthase TruA [Gammaproteobacteria bacterium]